MKSNIALVGFMGTGKSSVGRGLADRLQKKFVEMDDLIVDKAGKSIPQIFADEGAIRFRELEMAVCKDVATMTDVVISCGGGVILNKLNLDYLAQSSEILCLYATAKEIFQRVMAEGKEKRPLLAKPNPMQEIRKLLEYRKPLYERSTNLRINTTNKTLKQIEQEIIDLLEGNKDVDALLKTYPTPERCCLCKSALIEVEPLEEMVCLCCGKEKMVAERCEHHHFVCDKCTATSLIDLISSHLGEIEDTIVNVTKIAQKILEIPHLSPRGSEHYAVVSGALLKAARNALRTSDYRNEFGYISAESIIVANKRLAFLPKDMSSYYGMSGCALAIGTAVASFLDSTPLRKTERIEAQAATIMASLPMLNGATNENPTSLEPFFNQDFKALLDFQSAIAWPDEGFQQCVKREVFHALEVGARIFRDRYKVPLESETPRCPFSSSVDTCVKELCRYYPQVE